MFFFFRLKNLLAHNYSARPLGAVTTLLELFVSIIFLLFVGHPSWTTITAWTIAEDAYLFFVLVAYIRVSALEERRVAYIIGIISVNKSRWKGRMDKFLLRYYNIFLPPSKLDTWWRNIIRLLIYRYTVQYKKNAGNCETGLQIPKNDELTNCILLVAQKQGNVESMSIIFFNRVSLQLV